MLKCNYAFQSDEYACKYEPNTNRIWCYWSAERTRARQRNTRSRAPDARSRARLVRCRLDPLFAWTPYRRVVFSLSVSHQSLSLISSICIQQWSVTGRRAPGFNAPSIGCDYRHPNQPKHNSISPSAFRFLIYFELGKGLFCCCCYGNYGSRAVSALVSVG